MYVIGKCVRYMYMGNCFPLCRWDINTWFCSQKAAVDLLRLDYMFVLSWKWKWDNKYIFCWLLLFYAAFGFHSKRCSSPPTKSTRSSILKTENITERTKCNWNCPTNTIPSDSYLKYPYSNMKITFEQMSPLTQWNYP